jgi:hypothetical protein
MNGSGFESVGGLSSPQGRVHVVIRAPERFLVIPLG